MDTPAKTNIANLFDRAREWGIGREIIGLDGKGTIARQMDKVKEEVMETDSAINWYESQVDWDAKAQAKLEIIDGIGDTMVALILLAEFVGIPAEECLDCALEEIEKRTGIMVDGRFIKDR